MKVKVFNSKKVFENDRIYKITLCTGTNNPLLLKKHVIKMFMEYCRFAETVYNHSFELDYNLNIFNEVNEFDIILHHGFEKDITKLKFGQGPDLQDSDIEFIKFEIFFKKTPKEPYKTSVEFYRELEHEFKKEIKKVSEETDEKIKKLLFANSKEIYSVIQTFSDNFVAKWGPRNPRDPIEMSKDFESFNEKLFSIKNLCHEYIDKKFKKGYIEPIEQMFKNTQSHNINTVSKENDITKAIYENNPKKLSNTLTKVNSPVKVPIGDNKITPLMFACSCFPGFNKNKENENNIKNNNLQIISLLLMYGSDLYQKDIFGRNAADYIKYGTIMFGHTKPNVPTDKEILDLLKRYNYKEETTKNITSRDKNISTTTIDAKVLNILIDTDPTCQYLPIKDFNNTN